MTASGMALAKKVEGLSEAGGPWLLPRGWTWAKIEAVLAPMADGRILHHGWSPQCDAHPSESVELWGVLKTTAIQPGSFLAHENKALPKQLKPRLSLEVTSGDILLTCAGPRSRCGVACLVRQTRPRLMISGKMYRFRCDPSVMHPRFLEAFLQTSHAWRSIDEMKTGGSDSGLNLTHGRFRQLLVPVAPLAEQRRIVARLDGLFAEISEGDAALAVTRDRLGTFRRALLRAAVAGELTQDWREVTPVSEASHDFLARVAKGQVSKEKPKRRVRRSLNEVPLDASKLPKLPAGWAWTTLGSLVTSGPTNGYSPKKSIDGSGTLALKLTATTNGQIDLSERAIKALSEMIPSGSDLYLKPGDLLFQRGNTIEYVGIAAIYDGPLDKYVYPDLMIRVRTGAPTLTEWVWRVANSPFGRKYMADNATGTAGTMPKITGQVVRNLPIPIPPPAEATEILRRISDALTASTDALAILDAEAADVARLRQSLLKTAFEGRLVSQDPPDALANSSRMRSTAAAQESSRAKRGRARKSNV